jgi:hypothetical protein
MCSRMASRRPPRPARGQAPADAVERRHEGTARRRQVASSRRLPGSPESWLARMPKLAPPRTGGVRSAERRAVARSSAVAVGWAVNRMCAARAPNRRDRRCPRRPGRAGCAAPRACRTSGLASHRRSRARAPRPARRVHLDLVRGHGLGEQGVVGPHRGHEIRPSRVSWAPLARPNISARRSVVSVCPRPRGHIGVGRKEVAEIGATRYREDARHQKEPAHGISES